MEHSCKRKVRGNQICRFDNCQTETLLSFLQITQDQEEHRRNCENILAVLEFPSHNNKRMQLFKDFDSFLTDEHMCINLTYNN